MKHATNLIGRASRLAGALLVPFAFIWTGVAHAATANSIYSFTLNGSSATVANAAASNPGANLTLTGNWSQSAYGVHFTGTTDATQKSAGYYKPATGNTINAPANNSVGGVVRFKYQAPATGSCFSDSPNIAQIGLFQAAKTQLKIQLSNCGNSSTHVNAQCRVAGNSTPTGVFPVTSPINLVDGGDYIATCYKTPDASGNTVVTFRVVKVDITSGNTIQTNNFTIPATGVMSSTQYLSVGNKYAIPTPNTDQFIGDISKVAYCTASTTAAVTTCLDTEIPEPTQVNAVPTVSTALSASANNLKANQPVTYTATTRNTKVSTTATGAALTVAVPAGLTITSAPGAATWDSTTATWNVGDLVGGDTPFSAQVVANLDAGTPGTTLTTTAVTTTNDGSCTSGCTANAPITIMGQATLGTLLSANPTNPQVSQNLTYTATVDNTATSSVAHGTSVTINLPSGMSVSSAAGSSSSTTTSATWNLGDIADADAPDTVQLVARLDSGAIGDTLTATATTTSSDAAQSSASAAITVAPATLIQYVTNPGVETSNAGWTNKYGTSTQVTVIRSAAGSHAGVADLLITGVTGASNSSLGFADPVGARWVMNTNNTKSYTGSVWVKPSYVGQNIVLRLREVVSGTSTIVYDPTPTTIVAASTNWVQITETITPRNNGDGLAFTVYATGMNVGTTWQADDMSLTSN